jgi:hypothetical protein
MANDPQSANAPSSPDDESSANDDSPRRDVPPFDGPGDAWERGSWGREASGSSPFGDEASVPFGDEASVPDAAQQWLDQGAMWWSMARFWVKQNQSKAMLGALALGAFTGAMLRD